MTKKPTDIRTLRNLITPVRYSIHDCRRLHLWVRPDLRKYWVYRFTFEGKRYDMSLGSFPEISLADARAKATKLNGKLLSGINPIEAVKAIDPKQGFKPTVTFAEYSLEYIQRMSPSWSNLKHAEQWTSTIKNYAFPIIGSLSLREITTDHILQILNPIWTTKNETASRLRGRLERILSASITSELRDLPNPAIWRGHLSNLLPQIKKSDNHHEALPYNEIPALIAMLKNNSSISSLALQFTILNASRTGEVLNALRSEISESIWSIPASRMKAKKEHQVPLCKTSLEIILRAQEMDPNSRFIFSRNGKPLSNMAMLSLVREIISPVTVHGFRSSFRDWVAEETDHSPEVAEMALAHTISNRVEAAYRRGKLLERRRLLMIDWEAFCYAKHPDQHN